MIIININITMNELKNKKKKKLEILTIFPRQQRWSILKYHSI
jgi:hypothetical protein